MKRYEYAYLSDSFWGTGPGYFQYDNTGKRAKPMMETLNELARQGWRITPVPWGSWQYFLERELPN